MTIAGDDSARQLELELAGAVAPDSQRVICLTEDAKKQVLTAMRSALVRGAVHLSFFNDKDVR